jgi:hypothetical protein
MENSELIKLPRLFEHPFFSDPFDVGFSDDKQLNHKENVCLSFVLFSLKNERGTDLFPFPSFFTLPRISDLKEGEGMFGFSACSMYRHPGDYYHSTATAITHGPNGPNNIVLEKKTETKDNLGRVKTINTRRLGDRGVEVIKEKEANKNQGTIFRNVKNMNENDLSSFESDWEHKKANIPVINCNSKFFDNFKNYNNSNVRALPPFNETPNGNNRSNTSHHSGPRIEEVLDDEINNMNKSMNNIMNSFCTPIIEEPNTPSTPNRKTQNSNKNTRSIPIVDGTSTQRDFLSTQNKSNTPTGPKTPSTTQNSLSNRSSFSSTYPSSTLYTPYNNRKYK